MSASRFGFVRVMCVLCLWAYMWIWCRWSASHSCWERFLNSPPGPGIMLPNGDVWESVTRLNRLPTSATGFFAANPASTRAELEKGRVGARAVRQEVQADRKARNAMGASMLRDVNLAMAHGGVDGGVVEAGRK